MTLEIEQQFTGDAHPFELIAWEKRHVKIEREDGSVAFEMKDAEFPVLWSTRASDIVASKYFRVVNGEQETSVRQMIHRVANTIATWGLQDGYFDQSAYEAFYLELCYILLHQLAAFNSPVWFNVGVQDKPQCSACQPGHALISTPQGMIPIKEIVDKQMIGCRVFDRWEGTNVIAAQKNGEKEVFRVTLNNGQFIEATADHIVLSVKHRRTKPEWMRVDELCPGMRLQLHPHTVSHDTQCDPVIVSQAALAGWLLTDGFVGQYDHGTNQSLIVEFETINDEEFGWVTDHLSKVFPNVTPNIRHEVTQDTTLTYKRLRIHGEQFRTFVENNKLTNRKVEKTVPQWLYDAPLSAVVAFLRSVFQADGYVVQSGNGAFIGLQSVSQIFIEGLQLLLLRLGIYSRVLSKRDKRADRLDGYQLSIGMQSERQRFADSIGFISDVKSEKLHTTLDLNGKHIGALREESVVSVASIGVMPVYDIQTGSGNYLSNNIVVHNCFILDVDDNMESILEWYRTEGMIFKNGSGAGINISKLRSKNAPISSGGKASGPVSFMRGADTNASVIKSGGTTRRAAKMVIMDVDHPDIEEFIWCKAKAEKMAQSLIQAGYASGLEGEVQETIPFQNANNSVSVSDDFMQLAALPGPHGEKGLLLCQIAYAAWECGDPGLFFVDTINKWNTTPNKGRIVSTNPCSEFVRPPNEACNLASINLLSFLTSDNLFDHEAFRHVVDIMITAMDIIVDRSSYPTELIAKNSHDYRSLGLGYANLGALLMSKGVSYDSGEGRQIAADITALMTGEAYLQSARIAQVKGPFYSYPENGDEMLAVLDQHSNALTGFASDVWREAKHVGLEWGYRNCQVTLLAPTGTISFLMDCDTTGIEPCLGLVQHKKLVGGGTVKMPSLALSRGLEALGYDRAAINKIIVDVENTGSLQRSVQMDYLNAGDLDVFATALGDNTLSWEAHVKMVAAVQPFLSGAVSKTINMPHESTVEDIEQAFIMAWKLGLKSIAVYRDGCKTLQPVTVQKTNAGKFSNEKPDSRIRPEGDTTFWECTVCASKPGQPTLCESCLHNRTAVMKLQSTLLQQAMRGGPERKRLLLQQSMRIEPERKRLPKDRPAHNHKFQVGNHEGYLNVGLYPDSQRPGELFITMSKEGSTVRGLMDTIGVLTSLLLQYGVPLSVLTDKLRHTRFEPAGFTGNPKLPMASSVIDYIFRWLSIQFDRDVAEESAGSALQGVIGEQWHGAPMCPECGVAMLRRTGNCFVCDVCGSSAGCS